MSRSINHLGALVSFEGIEAAGKSTQIKFLFQKLEEIQLMPLHLREPGGTDFGELLRQVLLAPKNVPPSPLAQALTFIAARAELLEKKIIPHLEKPKSVVLLDRFIDSTLAYQGMGQGLGIQEVLDLHRVYPLSLRPDLTFYLKIDWETCKTRMKNRGGAADFFEGQDGEFHQRLIKAFDHLANLFPERIKIIDATKGQDEVKAQIWETYCQKFPEHTP